MLTDLSFLEPGAPWPPEDPDTRERLRKIRDNRLLFDSEAEKVYGKWISYLDGTSEMATHYVLSFHRRLAFLWADLIFGEEPEYTVSVPDAANAADEQETNEDERQAALDELVLENHLNATAHEVTVDISRYGEGVFRLRREEGRVVIEGQSPEYWFPVVSESNVRKVLYHVLAWTFTRTTPRRLRNPETTTYLRCEIHGAAPAGRIEHRVYKLSESGFIEEQVDGASLVADWPGDVEETGANMPLVLHAPGARTTDRLHGLDDYAPIDSHMEYLMWNMAARQVILHKHSDPSMAGPPIEGTTTDTGEQVYASGSRYFTVEDESGAIPQYITWDGKLEGSYKQDERLWENVYRDSETSPTAFSSSESGAAESGTALRLRMMPTLKKAERMAQRIHPVMRDLFNVAGQLMGVDLSATTIEWKDGLPQDEREASEISQRDIESGITSRKSEMVRRYGYTDKQADEELEQISTEQAGQEPDPISQLLRGNGGGVSIRNGAQEEGQQDSRLGPP